MTLNKLIVFMMLIGSVIGGYVPVLFGAKSFGFTSLFGGAVGALLGIWLAVRISR